LYSISDVMKENHSISFLIQTVNIVPMKGKVPTT